MAQLIPVSRQEEDLWSFIKELAHTAGGRWEQVVTLGGTMVRVHEVLASRDGRRVTRPSSDLDVAVDPVVELAAPTAFRDILKSLGLHPEEPEPDQVTFVRRDARGDIELQVDLVAAVETDRFTATSPKVEVASGHRVAVAPGADLAIARAVTVDLEVASVGHVTVRIPDLPSAIVTKLCNLRLDRDKMAQDLRDFGTLLDLVEDTGPLVDLLRSTKSGTWAVEALELFFGPGGEARGILVEAEVEPSRILAQGRALLARVKA